MQAATRRKLKTLSEIPKRLRDAIRGATGPSDVIDQFQKDASAMEWAVRTIERLTLHNEQLLKQLKETTRLLQQQEEQRGICSDGQKLFKDRITRRKVG